MLPGDARIAIRRRLRWAGHVAGLSDMENIYITFRLEVEIFCQTLLKMIENGKSIALRLMLCT